MVSRAAAKKEKESKEKEKEKEATETKTEEEEAKKEEEEKEEKQEEVKEEEKEDKSGVVVDEEESRVSAEYASLCRELNMDASTGEAAWNSYKQIKQNYTLEVSHDRVSKPCTYYLYVPSQLPLAM